MLEMIVKGNMVSINAAGIAVRLVTEAACGVSSLIGQIASTASDNLDKDRLMKIMLDSFIGKLNEAMDDRLGHNGGD